MPFAADQSLFDDGSADETEIVLGYIAERKRMDDLSSSIMDGRFREQSVRRTILFANLYVR